MLLLLGFYVFIRVSCLYDFLGMFMSFLFQIRRYKFFDRVVYRVSSVFLGFIWNIGF